MCGHMFGGLRGKGRKLISVQLPLSQECLRWSELFETFIVLRGNPIYNPDATAWCIHYTTAPKPRQVVLVYLTGLGNNTGISPVFCSVRVLLYNKMKVKMAAC